MHREVQQLVQGLQLIGSEAGIQSSSTMVRKQCPLNLSDVVFHNSNKGQSKCLAPSCYELKGDAFYLELYDPGW